MGLKEFFTSRSLKVKDDRRTKAAQLTLRESVYPICLVTILFFLWGFSYGLLDTLNVTLFFFFFVSPFALWRSIRNPSVDSSFQL